MSKFKSSLVLLLFFILTLSLKDCFIHFLSCCLPCGNFFSLHFSLPYLSTHKYMPPDYFNKENGKNPNISWLHKIDSRSLETWEFRSRCDWIFLTLTPSSAEAWIIPVCHCGPVLFPISFTYCLSHLSLEYFLLPKVTVLCSENIRILYFQSLECLRRITQLSSILK